MKLTSLILSGVAFCSALATAQENYSLWPRRPVELEQAQRHIQRQEYDQALELLAPFVHHSGLTGRESRQLTGAIRIRRYLSAQHPRAQVYTVRRGENIERIATAHKSSRDLLILINSLISPSDLKVGQKLLIIPQDLRAELHMAEREISVWDGRTLVAVYDATPTQELTVGAAAENEETQLREREGEMNGARVPRSSATFPACDKILRLANGITLTGNASAKGRSVYVKQRELNELALLLGVGARVSIVRDEQKFDPFTTPE